MNQPSRPTALAIVCCLMACACAMEVDGEVGLTTFAIDNASDQALLHDHEVLARLEVTELASEAPPETRTDILRTSTSDCFGCAHPPTEVFSRLTIRRADAAVVLDGEVMDADWTRSDSAPTGGTHDAHYTLTITQADVDRATEP